MKYGIKITKIMKIYYILGAFFFIPHDLKQLMIFLLKNLKIWSYYGQKQEAAPKYILE